MEQLLQEVIEKKGKEYFKENIRDIVHYCWFMDQTEGLEDYINNYCNYEHKLNNSVTNEQFDRIIELLSKKLGNTNELDTLKYIYEKSGYLIHSTRESMYEVMKNNNGLDGNHKPFDMNEFIKVDKLMKEKYHDRYGIFGWLMLDVKNGKDKKWFFDKTAQHALYYANGPECFSQFCGGAYADTYEEKQAFKYCDKECAESNITKYCKRLHMSKEDLEYVLTIFDKYWNKFAYSKQVMLIINQKDGMDMPTFDELVEECTIDGKIDIEELKMFIFYKVFADEINLCSDKYVPFENITKLDISQFFEPKKIKITPLEVIEEEKKEVKEEPYKHLYLISNILKSFLTQYGMSIEKNIRLINSDRMDNSIKFKNELLMIAERMDGNIFKNITDDIISKESIKVFIDNLFKSLFIDKNNFMNVLSNTYKYMYEYDDIMKIVLLGKKLGLTYNEEPFIVNGKIEYINKNIKFDKYNEYECSYNEYNKLLIKTNYSIDTKLIGDIINNYKVERNLSDEDIKNIFVDLYDLFHNNSYTDSNEELNDFYDEILT